MRGRRSESRGRKSEGRRRQETGGRGQKSEEIIGDGRGCGNGTLFLSSPNDSIGEPCSSVIPERFYRGTRTSCGFPLKTCENDSDGGTCGMTAVVEYAGKVI